MSELKEKLDYWGGPVVANDDRYFEDLESAVEYFRDDCYSVERHGYVLSEVPEYIECCNVKPPDLTRYVERMIERYDEDNPMDETQFGEHADIEDLQRIVKVWVERQNFSLWHPNGNEVHFRPLVLADIKEWEENENPPHPIFET